MVWPVFLYCLVEFRTFPTSNFSNPFSPSFLNLTLLKPSPSQLAACFCYTLYVCFCYTLYVRNSKSLKLEKFEVGRVNITIKYMLIFRNTFQWCKFYVCFIWKDIDTYILVIKSHVFPFKNNYNNDIANFVAYCLIYKISNFPT